MQAVLPAVDAMRACYVSTVELHIVLTVVWIWPAVEAIKAMRCLRLDTLRRRALAATISIGACGALLLSSLGLAGWGTYEARAVGWVVVDLFIASGMIGALAIMRDKPASRETASD